MKKTKAEQKKSEPSLKAFVVQLAIFTALVVSYFFLVLSFFSHWLKELFDQNKLVYALVAWALIATQAVGPRHDSPIQDTFNCWLPLRYSWLASKSRQRLIRLRKKKETNTTVVNPSPATETKKEKTEININPSPKPYWREITRGACVECESTTKLCASFYLSF